MANYIVKKFTPAPVTHKQRREKQLFSLAKSLKKMNANPQFENPIEVILKDGRTIEVDKLAPGGITMIKPHGVQLSVEPLGMGTYRLEDGRQLVMSKGGVILTVGGIKK